LYDGILEELAGLIEDMLTELLGHGVGP